MLVWAPWSTKTWMGKKSIYARGVFFALFFWCQLTIQYSFSATPQLLWHQILFLYRHLIGLMKFLDLTFRLETRSRIQSNKSSMCTQCVPSCSASFIRYIIILAGTYAFTFLISCSTHKLTQENCAHYPTMFLMAMAILPIQGSSVPCEWVFLIWQANNYRLPIPYYAWAHGSTSNAEVQHEA